MALYALPSNWCINDYIMKKILISLAALALMVPANAQFFNRLVDKARESAEQAVERKVEQAVEEGVDKALDPETYKNQNEQQENQDVQQQPMQGWTCPACGAKGQTGKFCTECGAKKPEGDGTWTCPACGAKGQKGKFCTECGAAKPGAQTAQQQNVQAPQPKKEVESTYAKSDFVRGDEVFFEDDFANEQLGEFPSKWDINSGAAEVASLNGQKYILFTEYSGEVVPLMEKPEAWLPDQFTAEWDVYLSDDESLDDANWLVTLISRQSNWNDIVGQITLWWRPNDGDANVMYENIRKPDNKDGAGGSERELLLKSLKKNAWNHCGISFNKRALKFYVNGTRIFQIPNMMAPEKILFQFNGAYKYRGYTNVVIAKGAVPLYNRLASTGRIITYGITFDIGKATIKPQSLPEINRFYDLMMQNPDLKFEVQGHTDNTGTVAGNQKLSEQRAQAIVDKLVSMGIAANRLTAKGMGQSSPLADNSTDEGRAKNRRVEFIKK